MTARNERSVHAIYKYVIDMTTEPRYSYRFLGDESDSVTDLCTIVSALSERITDV